MQPCISRRDRVINLFGGLPIKFSLLYELRRRHVVKNALLYVVTSWLLLQAADVLFPALRIEDWAFPLLLGLLLLFFVPALIFSWVYEMTPTGLKLEKDVEHDSSEMIASGIKINKVIAVLLAIAIGAVAVDRLIPENVAPGSYLEGGPDKNSVSLEKALQVNEVLPLPLDRSIAVLSFVNLSDGPGAESFGDSIAEQVMNLLAHVNEFRVTSRSSAFAYKNQNLDSRQIGKALNVANILEGSFNYVDSQIRITTELIETSSDRILWSETYDRPLVNTLSVQDEIAAEIVGAVKATLLAGGSPVEMTCLN